MTTTIATRKQKMAEQAYACISARDGGSREYRSFALRFPALVLKTGLCQAIAFAEAKKHDEFLEDLVKVLAMDDITSTLDLAKASRTKPLYEYMLLARVVLQAASWLKRYVEALGKSESDEQDDGPDSNPLSGS